VARGLRPGAVLGIVRELSAGRDPGPLVVAGPTVLADALRKELGRAGEPGAIRGGPVEGAAALVHVLAAAPREEDEATLKAAHRARVPIVVVLAGPSLDDRIPYVLATDVVHTPAGAGFDIERIAHVIAARLGEQATGLAARLPVLRGPVVAHLVERFSRMNGVVGAVVFVPGADFPVMTLNQIRMVLRVAHAHGVEVGQERLPEVLATVGSGFAFRTVARQLLGFVPVAGWAVKAGIGYGGTKAMGEAARRYFGELAERGEGSVRSGS
jgi:uncharacterized protein (DUF697 family)